MKNYKEMADAVFARRDEYVASVKRKKKIALSTSLSLCAICLAVVGAIGIWRMGVVEPDPSVIGIKPPRATHSTTGSPTEVTVKTTSTGAAEKPTSDPKNPTESTKPTGTKPQASTGATDPTEKPAKPTKPAATKPSQNSQDATSSIDRHPDSTNKPTVIPTRPVVTDPVESSPSDGMPQRPPTEPVVTEPTESTESTDGGIHTPDVVPPKPSYPEMPPCSPMDPTEAPVEPTTASPTTRPSHGDEGLDPESPAWPDEPVATEPCTVAPTLPSTQGPVVEGRVTDQNGKAVEGVEIRVYSYGMVVASYTTGSNGYFYMSGFRSTSNTFVEVYSVPTGYIKSSQVISVTDGYNYAGFLCPKK